MVRITQLTEILIHRHPALRANDSAVQNMYEIVPSSIVSTMKVLYNNFLPALTSYFTNECCRLPYTDGRSEHSNNQLFQNRFVDKYTARSIQCHLRPVEFAFKAGTLLAVSSAFIT